MADELAKALSKKIGTSSNGGDSLMKAMKALLVLLLTDQEPKTEDEEFSDELGERIKNKYPRYSSLANKLIPKPM